MKLRHIVLGVFLSGLWVAAVFAQQPQPPPAPSPQPAATAAEEQKALQAIDQATAPAERATLIEQFLQKYPDGSNTWNLCLRAVDAFRQINNHTKALEYGERAIALQPENPTGRMIAADLLADASRTGIDAEQKLTRAEKYAREALDLLPPFFATWSATPLMTAEELETRKKLFEAQAHGILGYIHLLRNENPLGEEELLKAIELSQAEPNQADYLLLGHAYLRQGKYEQAIPVLRKAVAMGGAFYETARQLLQAAEEALAQRRRPAPPESKPQEQKPPQP